MSGVAPLPIGRWHPNERGSRHSDRRIRIPDLSGQNDGRYSAGLPSRPADTCSRNRRASTAANSLRQRNRHAVRFSLTTSYKVFNAQCLFKTMFAPRVSATFNCIWTGLLTWPRLSTLMSFQISFCIRNANFTGQEEPEGYHRVNARVRCFSRVSSSQISSSISREIEERVEIIREERTIDLKEIGVRVLSEKKRIR